MIVRFGFVSGIGWLIDFCFFVVLGLLGVPIWAANMLGASVAVLFVFFASVRHVFECEDGYLIGKLITYVFYQTIAIIAASLLIEALTRWLDLAPVLTKIAVTPLSFYANFQFMSFITTGKLRLI